MMDRHRQSVSFRAALFLVATGALSSCGYTIVRTPIQVEMQRSEEQTLIVKNSGDQTITLVSNQLNLDALWVEPGASEAIGFTVASVREAGRADDMPWLRAVSSSSWNVIIATTPNGYLEQEDADAVLRLRVDEQTEPPLVRRLSLAGCNLKWSETSGVTADHVIDLAKSPLAGVLERLCPK